MSDLLQTIQNTVAKEFGFIDWDYAYSTDQDWKLWPEVCKRYAFEVAKASLKQAKENIRLYPHQEFDFENEENIKL